MSTITIIGTGNMARTLGARALTGGNTVEIMGRDQAKATRLAELLGDGASAGAWGAVPSGDIVVMALLADGIVPTAATYGDALAGKVIIDISNPFNATADGLTLDEGTSNAQELAHTAPASAHVVKGFNTIFRQVLEDGQPDVFIAGDDARAKADVKAFIESLGLRPRDVGNLKMAHWLEGAGLLAVGLANNGMRSFDFSLGVTEARIGVGA
jgi:predicted dinucleotide-binding enzyme